MDAGNENVKEGGKPESVEEILELHPLVSSDNLGSQSRTADDKKQEEENMLNWDSIDFGFIHKIIKKMFGSLGGSNTAGQMIDDFYKVTITDLSRYFPPVLPHPRPDLPLL